jgi:thiol-disulfide isomerase/thioredoxin
MKKLCTLILLFFTSISFISCQQTTTTTSINFDLFKQITQFQSVFAKSEGTYLVYVYSDSCGACALVKQDVYDFASTYTQKPIYFFNVTFANDASEYRSLYLTYIAQNEVATPVILVVKDGAFDSTNQAVYYHAGVVAVRNILRDVKNGAFDLFKPIS